jgi:ornithine cyclodeaminase/alanine dehydrogenase-like protein (mu-crystallin family)
MRYLNADEIMQAVSLEEVMASVEEAFRIDEAEPYTMPDRMAIDCGDGNLFLLMPCVARDSISTKLVTVFPKNRARNRPVIDGIVVLSDRSTGEILALMDGKTITAMRTGAVTGVSIRHLAKAEAQSVGIVGCGVQSFYQLMFACAARDICTITLFDIDPTAVASLTQKLRTDAIMPPLSSAIEIQVAESTATLIQASDIVITATTARAPVFPNDPALFKGKHCVAIGSFEPEVREYPDAIFSLVEKGWVDTDFAPEESGELMTPLQKGILRAEQLETLGHFIQSGRTPERGVYGTTFFKSVGMAMFDLTTARLTYTNALQKGLGTVL